jgi:hypothetical protein
LIIYYELRLYRSSFCENKKVFLENFKFFNTQRKENLSIEKSNTFIDQNYLFDLSAKITSLKRVGDEFQNFILSIISRKNQNNKLELNEEEVIIMEDLNKYLFKSNINYKFKQKVIDIFFSVFMLELKSLSSHICEWREKQLNLISKQIQQNLRAIQSPLKEKCENMKKIYCDIPSWVFGTQIEQLMLCLIKGYYTITLVIIRQLFINYLDASNKKWDEFILPISEICQPNHLLDYETNQNDSSCSGEGMSQLTGLLKLNKSIRFRLK